MMLLQSSVKMPEGTLLKFKVSTPGKCSCKARPIIFWSTIERIRIFTLEVCDPSTDDHCTVGTIVQY